MEFKPKVSIIIPVYNGSNYLQEAIESALAQTYKNIEIIVVNDGSNDYGKTEKIAASYSDKIKYSYKENGGVASALNLGIRNMTGNYFSWLSHDDVYFPEKIEKQVGYLENKEDKQIITYCDCELIDKNSNIIRIFRIDQKYLKNIFLTILSTSIGGCSLLIPKVCFEKVGLFNERLKTTQDIEMWLRIAMAGFVFDYVPEILLKSRLHPEQGSNILKGHHRKERDEFYLWAIHYAGDEITSMYKDLNMLLLDKKCYNAHRKLLRIKYQNITITKYYSILMSIYYKYFMKIIAGFFSRLHLR